MKVRDVIDVVTNKRFYSICEVDEYIAEHWNEYLKPLHLVDASVEYLQNVDFNDEAYYISATILYQCDDGVVGIHGVYYIMYDDSPEYIGELCTAQEYVQTNKVVYAPK